MAGIISGAALGGVADPRLGNQADDIGTTRNGSVSANVMPLESQRRMSLIYTDSSITFEDYHFWANQSRAYEKTLSTKNAGLQGMAKIMLGRGQHGAVDTPASPQPIESEKSFNEKTMDNPPGYSKETPDMPVAQPRWGVSDSEWETAQRATRNATWGSVFYLITTDILGPYNVPWAISNMGYGPGIILYVTFGGFAAYSGIQLWQQFCGLDSTRYPMRNYGDLAFRVYGKVARLFINVLQSFQFFLNVALLIESNGQGLAQMALGSSGNGFLCFVVAEVVFMLAGMLLGQIRTLQRLSFLANLAVWLNVFVIFMTMAVCAKYGPNIVAAVATNPLLANDGPVRTSGYWPSGVSTGLIPRINGLMNGVFAYGGATLFNELMAEMRRPWDFWKAFAAAEIFIFSIYVTMGMVVYSYQGQYTYPVAYQGIPNTAYVWQTVGNAISFISGLIAGLLYGNIGIKVFYAAVLRDVFRAPALDTKVGKMLWIAVVPLYWGLAFIVAAAIPQIANLTSFVGAACILQFSYTFPPILKVGYNCQKDAMLEEEAFDPATGHANRIDSGMKRWIRGYKKQFAMNTFDMLYFFAALSVAGLGLYASIIGMHDSFAAGSVTPFSCKNPAG